MSSEVYSFDIVVAGGTTSTTVTEHHAGAVVSVYAASTCSAGTPRSISSITTGGKLDILGNATTAAIADSNNAQYEQTELGGTALDGGNIVVTMSGEVDGSGAVTVTIYVAP